MAEDTAPSVSTEPEHPHYCDRCGQWFHNDEACEEGRFKTCPLCEEEEEL